jgi:general secretion pathway protein D
MITPHVNTSNKIRMEIEQDISDLGHPIKILDANQWIIETKTAKTTVIASEGQAIVIAGLIHDQVKNSEEKIPILSNIPILGYLFKNKKNIRKKKNLVLILTPWIIKSNYDYQKIYNSKIKERKHLSSLFFGNRITQYNPMESYKKSGPIYEIIHEITSEMMKIKNGGPGKINEIIINNQDR